MVALNPSLWEGNAHPLFTLPRSRTPSVRGRRARSLRDCLGRASQASRVLAGGNPKSLRACPHSKPHRARPTAHPPHIVDHGPRLSAQGQRKASAPGTEPVAPWPQPIQAKGSPQRVPPCAWIGRRLMAKHRISHPTECRSSNKHFSSLDRKSTRLNSSHEIPSRMPSSA